MTWSITFSFLSSRVVQPLVSFRLYFTGGWPGFALNFWDGWAGGPALKIFKGGALMKAQIIEGPIGASPACCHSERSEESLRGFAYGVGDCSSAARSRQCGLKDSINAIFLARNHPLRCFSRAMAIRISPKAS